MVSSEKSGKKSHKSVDPSTPFLMRLYYTDRVVLFLVCGGNELFFMFLYCLAQQEWKEWSEIVWLLVLAMAPVMAFKQYMNLIQLVSASRSLAARDLEENNVGNNASNEQHDAAASTPRSAARRSARLNSKS